MDRATLYYYVGSKEELFDEVVTDAVLANVKMAEDILAGPGGAPEKLRAIVGSLMRSYAENYPFLYVFIQENLSHVSPTRSEWSKKMRAANKRYEEVVIEIIESGIAEGTIRPVPSPWVVAYGIIGMVAWTNRWFNPGTSPIDADDVAKSYADVLLQGLAVAD